LTIFLNLVTSFLRSAASRSVSTVTFLAVLGRLQRVLEELALDAEDRLAEHLDQPAVRVPREAVVTGLLGESLYGLVREADVQDGVHHARHGELGPGTDRDEEGVVGLAELLAHLRFEGVEMRTHLVTQCRRLVATVEVGLAGLGGDGEAGRDGEAEVGHLGEVGTLATQEVLEVLVALGEVVNELHVRDACCRRSQLRGDLCFPTRVSTPRGRGGCPDDGEHTQIEGAWVRPLVRHTAVTTRPPADRKSRRGKPGDRTAFTS
jgi:hypothetical protein